MSLNPVDFSTRTSPAGAPVFMLNLRITATRGSVGVGAAVAVGEVEHAVGDVAAVGLVQDERRRQVAPLVAGVLDADPARRVHGPVVVDERDPGVVGLDVLRRRRGWARRSRRGRDRRSSSRPSRWRRRPSRSTTSRSNAPSAAGLIGRPRRFPTEEGLRSLRLLRLLCGTNPAPIAMASAVAPDARVNTFMWCDFLQTVERPFRGGARLS